MEPIAIAPAMSLPDPFIKMDTLTKWGTDMYTGFWYAASWACAGPCMQNERLGELASDEEIEMIGQDCKLKALPIPHFRLAGVSDISYKSLRFLTYNIFIRTETD